MSNEIIAKRCEKCKSALEQEGVGVGVGGGNYLYFSYDVLKSCSHDGYLGFCRRPTSKSISLTKGYTLRQ